MAISKKTNAESGKIKENKTMKTFEIYFSDLTIATQKRLMDAVGISSPSEANWDIDMCPLAIYEFENSNKDSNKESNVNTNESPGALAYDLISSLYNTDSTH